MHVNARRHAQSAPVAQNVDFIGFKNGPGFLPLQQLVDFIGSNIGQGFSPNLASGIVDTLCQT
jgi:hypothetical protein